MSTYNSISSTIMWVGNGFLLKLKVKLSKMSNGYTKDYYSEYEYYNESFHDYVTNIYLDFNYALYIEPIRKGENVYMLIDYYGMTKLSDMLKKVKVWFEDEEYYLNIWGRLNGSIVLRHGADQLYIEDDINGCPIRLSPCVTCINGIDMVAIAMDIGPNKERRSEITFENLMNLIIFLDRSDLYSMAQSLVNFLHTPDPGTNRISMNEVKPTYIPGITGEIGRTMKNKDKFNRLS